MPRHRDAQQGGHEGSKVDLPHLMRLRMVMMLMLLVMLFASPLEHLFLPEQENLQNLFLALPSYQLLLPRVPVESPKIIFF